MTERTLNAFIDGEMVGTLRDNNGIWSFTYVDTWLRSDGRYPISPHLPLQTEPIVDSSTHRPVQWYFDNLLPEEEVRRALARENKLTFHDAFGLLRRYGAESAGSLSLLADEDKELAAGERDLPDSELAARIAAMPRVPLAAQAPKRMSLAGAHHKLAVILRGSGLSEAIGSTPSTHILKPNISDASYPHTVANEYFTMELARALGLPIPGVERHYVPAPVYVIERFDRVRVKGSVRRLHCIDACQLLNLDRSFKYEACSVEKLAEIASRCSHAAAARLRLFSWLVFNVLVGNSDAHLKNISFLVDRAGFRIAPHYDLLSVAVYDTKTVSENGRWPATELGWSVEGKKAFRDIDYGVLVQAGITLQLSEETARRLIDLQLERISDAAKNLYAEIEKHDLAQAEANNDLKAVVAGEHRLLRGIVHGVIADMVSRISASKPVRVS